MIQTRRLSLKGALMLGLKEQRISSSATMPTSVDEKKVLESVAANEARGPRRTSDSSGFAAMDEETVAKSRRLAAGEQHSRPRNAIAPSKVPEAASIAPGPDGGFLASLAELFDRIFTILQRLLGVNVAVQRAKAEAAGGMTAEAKAGLQQQVKAIEEELRQSKEHSARLRSELDTQIARLSAKAAGDTPFTAKFNDLGELESRVGAMLAKLKADLGDAQDDSLLDPAERFEHLRERRAVLEVELAQLHQKQELQGEARNGGTSRLTRLSDLSADGWRLATEILERQAELAAIDEVLTKLRLMHGSTDTSIVDDHQDQDEDDRGRGPQG
ncbi:hypothetical protein ACQ858_13605 [Variovorax ureilyticus]|uniref:hypothetical protein n=1 Tax=Variovorax ureilyticus TaxID=1836198 RepID=UPI003D67B468